MNSTADQSGERFSLFNDDLKQFYQLACSMNYLQGDSDLDKSTILSEISNISQRYWISRQLNSGGLKKILEVKDSATDRHVAMAVLHDSSNMEKVENFLREARINALLQHPNIMPVYDIGINALKNAYFTMKLVKKGFSLEELLIRLKMGKGIGSYKILLNRLEIFIKICDAIAYAHSEGIIHLDLKPANIQLDDFGQVLVCDWGLARILETHEKEYSSTDELISSMDFINLTLSGQIQGTPGYMAPEQASKANELPKDERTDIYALGAILYSLLSFQSPLKSSKVTEMLEATQRGEVIPLDKYKKIRSIPESLIKVTEKAMATNPDDRYQSVLELKSEIQAYINGFATQAEEAGLLTILKLFYQRHRIKCRIIILAILSIFSVATFMMIKIKRSELHALESEKTARAAERDARKAEKAAFQSEQKTKETLRKLITEQEERERFGQLAAWKNTVTAEAFLRQHKFLRAINSAKDALNYNNRLFRAWKVLFEEALTAQRIDQCIYYLEGAKKSIKNESESERQRVKHLMSLCKELLPGYELRGKLSESDFNKLHAGLKKLKYSTQARNLLKRQKHKQFPTDEQLAEKPIPEHPKPQQ